MTSVPCHSLVGLPAQPRICIVSRGIPMVSASRRKRIRYDSVLVILLVSRETTPPGQPELCISGAEPNDTTTHCPNAKMYRLPRKIPSRYEKKSGYAEVTTAI